MPFDENIYYILLIDFSGIYLLEHIICVPQDVLCRAYSYVDDTMDIHMFMKPDRLSQQVT